MLRRRWARVTVFALALLVIWLIVDTVYDSATEEERKAEYCRRLRESPAQYISAGCEEIEPLPTPRRFRSQ